MNTRRYPQQDGIRRLPQPYGPNDMGLVALLLCSAHAATPFYPAIQGIFLRLGVEVDAVSLTVDCRAWASARRLKRASLPLAAGPGQLVSPKPTRVGERAS
jgi:hypothetical protein